MPVHRMFSYVHSYYPMQFDKIWGDQAKAAAFWDELPIDCPALKQWQRKLLSKDLSKVLPFAIHGDAVPVFKHKSLMCWNASSLLAEGSARETKNLFFAYWHHLNAQLDRDGADTEEAIWKVAKWDIEALFDGKHPDRDWENKPWPQGSLEAAMASRELANGFCAVPWVLKGDLDHFHKCLKLEAPTSLTPCPWCRANRSNCPWTDFTAQAAWKSCLWLDDAQWRNAHPRRHPVFNVLCIGIHNLHVDVLHTLGLGVAQHLLGGVIWILVHERFRGTLAANLEQVWSDIRQSYIEQNAPTRIRRLTRKMYQPSLSDYPQMTTKGKETEHLVEAVLFSWVQHCTDSPHDASVTEALHCLRSMFDLCRRVGPSLQLCRGAKHELARNTDRLLLHYTALANAAAARGALLFNVTPKFHVAWHLSRQAQHLHPGAAACYTDESFVGIVKHIVKSSTNGAKLERVGDILFVKWLRGSSISWATRASTIFSSLPS